MCLTPRESLLKVAHFYSATLVHFYLAKYIGPRLKLSIFIGAQAIRFTVARYHQSR
jgi:hypothetical protein